jgi:hypothetical protein
MAGGSEQIGGAKVTLEVTGDKQFASAMANARQQTASLGQGSKGLAGALSAEARGWESVAIRRAATRASFSMLNGSMENTASNFAQILAISSPVSGALAGIGVVLAASLIPTFGDLIKGTDTFSQELEKVGKSSDDAAKRIENLKQRTQELIKVRELSKRGDFSAVNKKEQDIMEEMDQLKKTIAMQEGENTTREHKSVEAGVPDDLDLAKEQFFGMFKDQWHKQRESFDMEGLMKELGRESAKSLGINPDTMTLKEMQKLDPNDRKLPYLSLEEARQRALRIAGTGNFERRRGGGGEDIAMASIPTETLKRFLAPDIRAQMDAEAAKTGKPVDALGASRQRLQDLKSQLNEEVRQNAMSAFQEDRLKEANPREWQRFQIRKNAAAEKRWLQMQDPNLAGMLITGGSSPATAMTQHIDKIMQRELDLVNNRPGGIVGVSRLHDVIQQSILNDSARNTEINTKGTWDSVRAMERGIDKFLATKSTAVMGP